VISLRCYALNHILKQRIYDCKAVYPSAISKKVIDVIIELAEGDARVAIQTLKNAARMAEEKNKRKIEVDDVKKARDELEEIKKKYILDKLSPYHKLLFGVISQSKDVDSTILYSKFKSKCHKLNLPVRSKRSFSNYLRELKLLGIVKTKTTSSK